MQHRSTPIDSRRPRSRQGGFSMVEMLMTAFILSIGLLGLASLQAMSIRTNLTGKSTNQGVRVAELVMDSIMAEGRQLRMIAQGGVDPTVSSSRYFKSGTSTMTEYFSGDGTRLANATGAVYTAVITPSAVDLASIQGLAGRDFAVTVTWVEQLAPKTSAQVKRSVTLNREVGYAITAAS